MTVFVRFALWKYSFPFYVDLGIKLMSQREENKLPFCYNSTIFLYIGVSSFFASF